MALVCRKDRYVSVSVDSVYVQPDDGEISLVSGDMLAESCSKLKLSVAGRAVSIFNHGIALLSNQSNCMRVINLSCKSEGRVLLDIAGGISIPAGYEAVLTKNAPSADQVLSGRRYGDRQLLCHEIAGTGWLILSEVNVGDVIASNGLLRAISEHGRAFAEKMTLLSVEKLAARQTAKLKAETAAAASGDTANGGTQVAGGCNGCLE